MRRKLAQASELFVSSGLRTYITCLAFPGLEQVRQMLSIEEDKKVAELRKECNIRTQVDCSVRELLLSTESSLRQLLSDNITTTLSVN